MNEQNSTKRTAEVSQIASLIRAKAQKHPEVIDIVVALIDRVSQSSQPEIEALGKQLEQHEGDYPAIMKLLGIQPSTKQHIAPAQSLKIKGSALFLCLAIYFHCQTPKACFPRICTGIPRSEKRSPCNAASFGGICEGALKQGIPKSGDTLKGGCIQKRIDPAGSRRASQFCDSAISWTGARGSFSLTPFIHPKVVEKNALNFEGIETRSILSRLHRSVQSGRLTPSPLVSILTLFCVGGGVNLVHALVYRVGIRYRSPISGVIWV